MAADSYRNRPQPKEEQPSHSRSNHKPNHTTRGGHPITRSNLLHTYNKDHCQGGNLSKPIHSNTAEPIQPRHRPVATAVRQHPYDHRPQEKHTRTTSRSSPSRLTGEHGQDPTKAESYCLRKPLHPTWSNSSSNPTGITTNTAGHPPWLHGSPACS